ncbi:DUF1343 domain-containing protein [Runella zeae]|uniref:DUF1343 domain-containing protein n=1 Tax=Runella zeae TaxID=94255 RepID=UPI002357EA7F|nr:DUF1343 domain-containing protein [Runella zeae]
MNLASLISSFSLTQKRVGLLCNQTAFVFDKKQYLIELLAEQNILSAVFVPEHGLFAELQDQEPLENTNVYHFWKGIDFISLYGRDEQSLKTAPALLEALDVIIVDIQDVGCRYFTYLTTLAYLFETLTRCQHPPHVWVIDRPSPAGRQVEGSMITKTFSSFIGHEGLPHRHGLSLGEIALWLKYHYRGSFSLDLLPYPIDEYFMQILPSPNFPSLQTATLYSGQCLFEATTLSEGRGTTRPFEIIGAPFLKWDILKNIKHDFENFTADLPWVNYILRPLQFIPTFHKHANELCGGFQIHLAPSQSNHSLLSSLILLRICNEYIPNLWRQGAYEKGSTKTALEILVGDADLLDFVNGKVALSVIVEYLKQTENEWITGSKSISNAALFSVLT